LYFSSNIITITNKRRDKYEPPRMGRDKCIQNYGWGNLKRKYNLRVTGSDGRSVLKLLEMLFEKVGSGCSWLRYGRIVGFREDGDALSRSVEGR
jgi:hypothetical protein